MSIANRVIETKEGYQIRCPICGYHEFPKAARPNKTWKFDGDFEFPTFTPSMNELITPTLSEIPSRRCHFIITKGEIAFCRDCTHRLAGKSLMLEPWSDAQVLMAEFDLKKDET